MSDWDDLVEPARATFEALLRKGDAMADRIEELEAELAAAQAVIRKIVDPKWYADDPWGMATEYVASLQGDKT